MEAVNIHEAKTQLSRLVEEAARGEPFVIAKAGKPLVKVVPLEPAEERPKRRIGFLEGEVELPEDFNTFMQEEIIAMFDGKYKGVINPQYAHLKPKRLTRADFPSARSKRAK